MLTRPHLTYANITATVALLVALGGTGFAATQIGTSQIRNGAVTTAKLRDGAVSATKLAPRSITSKALGAGAVSAGNVASGSLTAAQFATGQLGGIDPAKITIAKGVVNLKAGAGVFPAFAVCPGGSAVVGGGFHSSLPVSAPGNRAEAPQVMSSEPMEQSVSPDRGWVVTALPGTIDGQVTAYAVCVAK